MSKCVISLIQLNSQDDITTGLPAIEAALRESAVGGADFVLLPENTFLMQGDGQKTVADQSEAINACRAIARELSLWILIGSVKAPATNGKYYNRSLLINSEGEIAAQYDKIHLFDVTLKNGEIYNESARIEGGTKAVLVPTPWGKLGMTVCYDLRFPHLYRELAQAGADFIAVPAAFTYTTGMAHWHTLLKARAIENGCYILAPAQCGTHPANRRTYGHSLAVSPWGEIIAEADESKTGITIVTLDMNKVQEARAMIPSLKHDKKFAM